MSKSKVYYFGPRVNLSDVAKGQRLFEEAELNKCFNRGETVAIKIHCGEWNNTGYLRPSIVAGIVEMVKEYGGEPFVCDTTTCYLQSRGMGQDMIKTAARNGFTPQTLDCPFIVADGDFGLDEVKVPVNEGSFLKYAYLAEAIANADALIILTHFKGHPQGVYGGSIKNVGIGCSSKQGKSIIHMFQHPRWGVSTYTFNPEKCKGSECPVNRRCAENCPSGSFTLTSEKPYAKWDRTTCIGCYECGIRAACGAILKSQSSRMDDFFPAVVSDAAKAYIDHIGRSKVGFINYAIDITPQCDCMIWSDSWILPNLGVFASKDIVSIDTACLDACDKAPGVPGSRVYDEGIPGEPWKAGNEKFTNIKRTPLSQWMSINAAVKIGLGSANYDLCEGTPGSREKYLQLKYREHPPGYYTRKAFSMHKPKFEPEVYLDVEKVTMEELVGRPKTSPRIEKND